MMGNWWQHKMDADSRRMELYREAERQRLADQLPGPASLVVDHWTVELMVGGAGISAVAVLVASLANM